MADAAQKEFCHPNMYGYQGYEEISFTKRVPLVAGLGSATGILRGIGQFGVIMESSMDLTGYKLEVYSELEMTNLVYEAHF